MPSQTLDPGIVAVRDIPYTAEPVDSAKQALDVYHQESAKNAPVLVFVHGGAWVRGDRKQYPFLANRFAREGYVVVVPSYRLSPKFVHPAHIEDVASAVAWTFRNIPARMVATPSVSSSRATLQAAISSRCWLLILNGLWLTIWNPVACAASSD